MTLTPNYGPDGVRLVPVAPQPGWLARLAGAATSAPSLRALTDTDQGLAMALADAQALARTGEIVLGDDLWLAHDLVARLDQPTAEALGLPPLVDLTFAAGTSGVLGQAQFALTGRWQRGAQTVEPRREGAILHTDRGPRRLPACLFEVLQIVENPNPPQTLPEQWRALGRFRQALDPEWAETPPPADFAGRMLVNETLNALTVRVASAIGLSPFEWNGALDFVPVPFSRRQLAARADPEAAPGEADGLLDQVDLAAFVRRFDQLGARPAYALGALNAYLIVERAAQPALEAMARARRADPATRQAFVLDPGPAIDREARRLLAAEGRLGGLSEAEIEAAVEADAGASFVETREYAERVVGVGRWSPPSLPIAAAARTTWLPEDWVGPGGAGLERYDLPQCRALAQAVAAAPGGTVSAPDGAMFTATPELATALEARIAALTRAPGASGTTALAPVVLDGLENFETLRFRAGLTPRAARAPDDRPTRLRTSLKAHQEAGLDWLIAVWRAGLPGALNADEQGLGKTLQAISFLAWLQDAAAAESVAAAGPVLVVAPTTLLENWEDEVRRHLDDPGLGRPVRLYGNDLAKLREGAGIETQDGTLRLDLSGLRGPGPVWALTTYQTLTNFHHSLGRIDFAAVVFDEIQALKNPAALRAKAALSVRARFRLGLTGTPIENSPVDLWSIIDQIAPGALGTLREFNAAFGTPTPEAMRTLHGRVFTPQGGAPALGLRRLKEDAARDLPPKRRLLYPAPMPPGQAARYAEARAALASGGSGAALRMLHHIRAVSAHPDLNQGGGEGADFIAASARLATTMEVLAHIQRRGERALVFIEHTRLQHRFVAVARAAFGLADIPIINGETPVPQRMRIVRQFQRHLQRDEGFDLLVLAPRAAGVGLTLTAATHVIHLSRWWNPAVEEQCNDRTHRIGQTRPVTIHTPLAIHPGLVAQSFDCLLERLMRRKRRLARSALWPTGDTAEDTSDLQAALMCDGARAPEGGGTELAELSPLSRRDGIARFAWTDGHPGLVVCIYDTVATEAAIVDAANGADIVVVLASADLQRFTPNIQAPVVRLEGDLNELWTEFVATGARAM